MSNCPSPDELRMLDSEAIDDDDFARLERHLERCEACRRAIDRRLRDHFRDEGTDRLLDSGATTVPPPPPPLPGYRIVRELGRGGMGSVYLATREEDGRQVALKFLGGGPNDLARWRREAGAMRRIDHPGVVRLLDAIEFGGWVCLVMEYAPGGSLQHRLDPSPEPRTAARFVAILAGAIEEVHASGLLHLDLKPSNILLGAGPDSPIDLARPMVADFGIALAWGDPDVTWTMAAGPRGTPSYMAPEQLSPERATLGPEADVYALGAILYRLLAGRPPFLSTSKMETYLQLRDREPVPLRRLNPNVPKALETICLACLRKSPGRRYPSARALADDLARFLSGKRILERPTPAPVLASRWARRNRALAGAGLALVAVTLLAFGLVVDRAGVSRAAAERAEAQREATALNLDLAGRAAKLGFRRETPDVGRVPGPDDEALDAMIRLAGDFARHRRDGRLADSNLLLMGVLQREIARRSLDRGDLDRAGRSLEHARMSLESLLERHPDHVDCRRELVVTLLDRARHFFKDEERTLRDLAEVRRHGEALADFTGTLDEEGLQLSLRLILADRLRRGGDADRSHALVAETRSMLSRIPPSEIASSVPLSACSAATAARLGEEDDGLALASNAMAMIAGGRFENRGAIDPVFRWFDRPGGPLDGILAGLRGPFQPKDASDWAAEIEHAMAGELERLGGEASDDSRAVRMTVLRGLRSFLQEIGAEHAQARRLREFHMVAHVQERLGYLAAYRDQRDAEAQALVRSGLLQKAEMFALRDDFALVAYNLEKALDPARRAVQRDPSSEVHRRALLDIERRLDEFRAEHPELPPAGGPIPDDPGAAD